MVRTFKKPPNAGYVVRERTYGTRAIQDKKTGRMVGRKKVRGKGDNSGVRRVKKDFILVQKSKKSRGHVRKRRYAGQILGRY